MYHGTKNKVINITGAMALAGFIALPALGTGSEEVVDTSFLREPFATAQNYIAPVITLDEENDLKNLQFLMSEVWDYPEGEGIQHVESISKDTLIFSPKKMQYVTFDQ